MHDVDTTVQPLTIPSKERLGAGSKEICEILGRKFSKADFV